MGSALCAVCVVVAAWANGLRGETFQKRTAHAHKRRKQIPQAIYQMQEEYDLEVPDSVPKYSPGSVAFSDEDPSPGYVRGTVDIGMAADERDVKFYKLFWAANQTALAGQAPIQVIPSKGQDLEFHLKNAQDARIGVSIPRGATELLARTCNEAGDSAEAAVFRIQDKVNDAGLLSELL